MTQTVTETADVTDQVTEDVGAQDELDTLLAQYDEAHEEPQKPTTTEQPQSHSDPRVEALLARQERTDIDNAVTKLKDESGTQLPDSMIEGYLRSKAIKDGRIDKAFNDRFNNPQGWEKVLKGLANDFKKEMESLPDSTLTANRDAVEAAVRSASSTKTAPEPAPDFSKMSKSQLDKYLMENG